MLRCLVLAILTSHVTQQNKNISSSKENFDAPSPRLTGFSLQATPAWIVLDDDLTTYEPVIARTINEWNTKVGFALFAYGGILDVDDVKLPMPFIGVVQIDLGTNCGHTNLLIDSTGKYVTRAK